VLVEMLNLLGRAHGHSADVGAYIIAGGDVGPGEVAGVESVDVLGPSRAGVVGIQSCLA